MKLNEIRSFVAVAEAESVQEASDRLHLTQSAVSRLVQRLEAEVGVTLFDRRTKPFSLTRDGQTALAHCRRVLKAVDDFAGAFSSSAEPGGVLRLGAAHALTAFAASKPLDMLKEHFPSLVVQLQSDWTGRLLEHVSNGALDGALILLPAGEAPVQDVDARCLSTEKVVVLGAKPHVSKLPLTLRAMNEIGWVLQPKGCGYRRALKRALEGANLPLNVAVEAFGQDTQLSLIARGFGLGLAPKRWLKETSFAGKVKALDVKDFDLKVSLWLVSTRHPGNLAGVFDMLESCLSKQHRA